jgi:hypothetical protein
MGHFGNDKSYDTLCRDFYWPNMQKDLVSAYVPSCTTCQRNKSSTVKPGGPLHPLPVPDKQFDSVAINFIGPLPTDNGFDCIVTMTNRLNTGIQLAPCKTTMTAEELATIFFNKWFCENGCPLELITDHDKLFMSWFWKGLMKLSGIKHKMSMAYHPQMDGASERSNKTVVQALIFHVEWNQTGWVKALPKVCFDMMNTINTFTSFTPFMLKSGHSPCLIPPLIAPGSHKTSTDSNPSPLIRSDTEVHAPTSDGENTFLTVINQIASDLLDAKDSLMAAKISQAHQTNKDCAPVPTFNVGNRVLLAMASCRREYMQSKDGRVAKFMPRFDGPFKVTHVYPDSCKGATGWSPTVWL